MTIADLLFRFQSGATEPTAFLREELFPRLRAFAREDNPVWILQRGEEELLAEAAQLEARRAAGEEMPLYGIPYAVKDNIDVAQLPTTAGCPEYAFIPSADATAVQLLRQAGAMLIGKTNLDQFATGLVGTRSPHGPCRSVFHPDYISGGSSSGSAVAVAAGLVAFSLGTDTAGSGRVPAAFNELIGYKATRGRISTKGVVPACRSLDCVTVFARTLEDASRVVDVIGQPDAGDPFSRACPGPSGRELQAGAPFTFGVPEESEWQFFGDEEAVELYRRAIVQMEERGGQTRIIDDRPLREAAQLLYAGPWVAERTVAIADFLVRNPDAIHPVVRGIIEGGRKYTAMETFAAIYRLQEYAQVARRIFAGVDFLLLPTAPNHYTVEAVLADPVRLNSQLGTYTNFVNLLDLAALAVPAGRRSNGCPFGVTLVGPAWTDDDLEQWAGRFLGQAVGSLAAIKENSGAIELAVCGAHLRGQPLHGQLLECGALFLEQTETASYYELYALPTTPPKPGLVRTPEATAGGIEVEVYQLSAEGMGRFLGFVPPPLAIGNLELKNGQVVKGFLCETYATGSAENITHLRSWRKFREAE